VIQQEESLDNWKITEKSKKIYNTIWYVHWKTVWYDQLFSRLATAWHYTHHFKLLLLRGGRVEYAAHKCKYINTHLHGQTLIFQICHFLITCMSQGHNTQPHFTCHSLLVLNKQQMPEQVALYFPTAKEFLILCSNFILQPAGKPLNLIMYNALWRIPFISVFSGLSQFYGF
jgi:hypothetical protein